MKAQALREIKVTVPPDNLDREFEENIFRTIGIET